MTQLIYTVHESAITFADSAQTPSANIMLSALAAAAARCSARYDRGADAKATLYKWRAVFQVGGTPVVGETIDVYLSTSDGTSPDGEIGTADAAVATAKLPNLIFLGSVKIESTTANLNIIASGVVEVPDRYLSVVVHNNATDPLRTDTSVHRVTLTPIARQIQDDV